VYPLKAVLLQRQDREEGRSVAEGVYGRADVVDVSGERQLGGTRATAYGVFGFEDGDVAPVSRQLHGCRKAVWPRADDHRIVYPIASSSAPMSLILQCVLNAFSTLHKLRNTVTVLMLEDGERPKMVQEMLGYTKVSQTPGAYSRVVPNMHSGAARFGAVLSGSASNLTRRNVRGGKLPAKHDYRRTDQEACCRTGR
jgi:hypothetical protein